MLENPERAARFLRELAIELPQLRGKVNRVDELEARVVQLEALVLPTLPELALPTPEAPPPEPLALEVEDPGPASESDTHLPELGAPSAPSAEETAAIATEVAVDLEGDPAPSSPSEPPKDPS